MKILLFTCGLLFASLAFSAVEAPRITNCSESLSFNQIYNMKTIAKSGVKIFDIDTEEPASASAGIAIAIDRGDDLSTAEAFCKYVHGLSGVNFKAIKTQYSARTSTVTLQVPVSKTDDVGNRTSYVMTVVVNVNAKNEDNLVKASLK